MTAEMRIPFSQLRFSDDAPEWGLQIMRTVARTNPFLGRESSVGVHGTLEREPQLRGELTAERPQEQQPEDRVLGHVRAFPENRVPDPEAGPEARDRRDGEDQRRPREHGQPRGGDSPQGHSGDGSLAPQPANGKGTRCKSGTVPPL